MSDVTDLDDELENLFNEMDSKIATIPVVKPVQVPVVAVVNETTKPKFVLPEKALPFEHRIVDIVESIYPDKWDYNHLNRRVIIKFDRLTVTNSKNERHEIRDLFVKMRFNCDGRIYDFSGARATVTIPEYQSNYAFSHLSTGAAQGITWGGFCLGSGTVRDTYERLCVDFDDMQFEMFLHSLTDYLSWESLEGGPYVRISSISFRNGLATIGMNTKQDTYTRYINKFNAKDLKYLIVTKPFRIAVDPNDPIFCQNVLSILPTSSRPVESTQMIVYRDDVTGQYFAKGYRNNITLGKIGEYPEVFKGERIKKQLIDIADEKSLKEYPNPDITAFIADKLSRAITLQAIIKGASNRRNPKGLVVAEAVLQDL
jgi:hypothetical protein